MVTLGANRTRSSKSWTLACSSDSVVIARTELGTSLMDSARLLTVTTISSSPSDGIGCDASSLVCANTGLSCQLSVSVMTATRYLDWYDTIPPQSHYHRFFYLMLPVSIEKSSRNWHWAHACLTGGQAKPTLCSSFKPRAH